MVSDSKIGIRVLRACCCPASQEKIMLPRALDAFISRSWIRSMKEVVAIFLDFKGERCSNQANTLARLH